MNFYLEHLDFKNKMAASQEKEPTIKAKWFTQLCDYIEENKIDEVYHVDYGVAELLYNLNLCTGAFLGGCSSNYLAKRYCQKFVPNVALTQKEYDPSEFHTCVILNKEFSEFEKINADYVIVCENSFKVLKSPNKEESTEVKPKSAKKVNKKEEQDND